MGQPVNCCNGAGCDTRARACCPNVPHCTTQPSAHSLAPLSSGTRSRAAGRTAVPPSAHVIDKVWSGVLDRENKSHG